MRILLLSYIFISLTIAGVFFWLFLGKRDLKGRHIDYKITDLLIGIVIGTLWPLLVIFAVPYITYHQYQRHQNKLLEKDLREKLSRFNNCLAIISNSNLDVISSHETNQFISAFKGLSEVETKAPFLFHGMESHDEFQTIRYKHRPGEIGKNEGGLYDVLLDNLFLNDEELLEKRLREVQIAGAADLPILFRRGTEQGDSWCGVFCKEFNKAVKNLDKNMKARVKEAIHEISLTPMTPKGDTIKKLNHIKDHWRYRIGPYRLLYLPDVENRKILFLKFDSRGDVYS